MHAVFYADQIADSYLDQDRIPTNQNRPALQIAGFILAIGLPTKIDRLCTMILTVGISYFASSIRAHSQRKDAPSALHLVFGIKRIQAHKTTVPTVLCACLPACLLLVGCCARCMVAGLLHRALCCDYCSLAVERPAEYASLLGLRLEHPDPC